MGLFRSGAQKRAEKYLQLANSFIGNIENDVNIFPNNDGMTRKAYEPLLGLCALLTASFCADPDAALDMLPTFQKQVLRHPITKEEYDAMTQRIGKYYLEYRDAAIDIQENVKEWLEPFMQKTVELTENYLQITHNDESSRAIQGHMQEYIMRARIEVRNM
ncbi:hypothetical protein [Papillibacter cinnamivorans]|uniref:Uncharacterized protein n=1 Tax=Papillibacter cinnamivorans DSM 12816 TaxID=1122930 RepID=A0A1W1ZG02_9FIRM|nr:hypothetical protein [Papillibacter cinnamivorans]SMC47276.1 hypothetical protein SAMN02745168_1045 [Papillibacter cinnamivorans DSM 12816]